MKTHEINAYELDLAEGRIEPAIYISHPPEEIKDTYYEHANEEISNLINARVEAIIDTRATARLNRSHFGRQYK